MAVDVITPLELKARMDAGDTPVLVDVRESFEIAIADLPDAGQLRIPMREVADRLSEIPKDGEVVVYCRSGARSDQVAQFLQSHGFGPVKNLIGGVLRWREDVDPSLTAY